jgi:putative ABC transport system permease protein
MTTPFTLARLSLSRRRVQSTVALLSIAFAIATSGVLLRLYRLSQARFSSIAHGGDALVGAKAGDLDTLLGALNLEGPYPGFIPYVLARSLQQPGGIAFADGERTDTTAVRAAIPLVYFADYSGFRVIGTDRSFAHRPEPQDDPILARGRWPQTVGETVLGAEVARSQHLEVGSRITLSPWTGPPPDRGTAVPVAVVGILSPTGSVWDRALFCDLSQAFAVLGASDLGNRSIWKGDVVNYFLLYVDERGYSGVENLINRRSVAQLVPIAPTLRRLRELTGTGTRLSFALCGLILFLGSLCVAAMMLTRFDAMLVQLAVLRALGYRRGELSRWLLWEGALLAAGASLLGGLLDALIFPWVRSLLGEALPPPGVAQVPIWNSAPIWALAGIATLLACTVPLWRLFHQDVHAALKGL